MARLAVTFAVMSILTVRVVGANLSGHWDVMMNPDFKGNQTTEHCLLVEKTRHFATRILPLER
jgi:hypothetical protein